MQNRNTRERPPAVPGGGTPATGGDPSETQLPDQLQSHPHLPSGSVHQFVIQEGAWHGRHERCGWNFEELLVVEQIEGLRDDIRVSALPGSRMTLNRVQSKLFVRLDRSVFLPIVPGPGAPTPWTT